MSTINVSAFNKIPPKAALPEMEGYFTALSPTPGTGLATIAALTTLADTSPFIAIHAPAAGQGAKSVYLDYIKLIVTAAGTAGASIRYAWKTDNGKAAPTGGTTITPNNTCSGGSAVAGAAVYAGPLVAAAAVAPKLIAAGLIRPVIPVVGDTYLFDFGPTDLYISTGLVPSGTAIADRYFSLPPAILRPGQVGQFHLWLPSQTGASSYEVEVGFYEF